jgi:hypothetical protein
MRSLKWCFVDELEPGDKLYDGIVDAQPETAEVVEVVALDLVRTPSGPCVWRVHTTGSTFRYDVMDRVAKVAA